MSRIASLAAALAILSGASNAQAMTSILSDPSTSRKPTGGTAPVPVPPNDPSCNFVHSLGISWGGRTTVPTWYAKSVSDLPSYMQTTPEVANGAFVPANSALIAQDKAVMAAMNGLVGGHLKATVASTPAGAVRFVFGSTTVAATNNAQTRFWFASTPLNTVATEVFYSQAYLSGLPYPAGSSKRGVVAHESFLHGVYLLDDNNPGTYYDVAATIGDTNGLSAGYSFEGWDHQNDDVRFIDTKLDACDIKTIKAINY